MPSESARKSLQEEKWNAVKVIMAAPLLVTAIHKSMPFHDFQIAGARE